MGQFNFFSNNISTWIKAWSKVVNPSNMVIAVPYLNPYPFYLPYPAITHGKYLFYTYDMGTTSPYVNMIKIIKEAENIYGILYVHDDMILHSSLLERIGKSDWIIANFEDKAINLYQNSSITSSRNITMIKGWKYWPGCQRNLTKMLFDERLKPYIHNSTNNNFFINITTGASDMLYAVLPNLEQKRAFLSLLELFAEHELHLECAIPTAVLMMQERFGIKVHTASLCTDWGVLRENIYNVHKVHLAKFMIEKCASENSTYEAYHPIKMKHHSDWIQYFDYIRNL